MLLWECSGLQPWDRRYKKGLEILHRPTPPVCLSSVSCRHTHDQISQVFSVHIWIPQTIKSGGDEGLRMRQRSAIFPHFWYTTSNQKLETKAVWEQKLTLRKYSYWGSFCSILIIAVDSKEGEVVMQSLLNLVLMSPHVRANTQRASRWILRTAVDAVLVNAVVTRRFCPGQCESYGVASTLRQSTGGGGSGGSGCGVKNGRDMHFNSAQEGKILFCSYFSTTY